MESQELITTIDTIIKLYTDRGIELSIQKNENKLLNEQIVLLKKELAEKSKELDAINKSRQEVRAIFEEIKQNDARREK